MEQLSNQYQSLKANTDIGIFEDFSYRDIHITLGEMEKNRNPANIQDAISIWDQVLSKKIQYDALNYAVVASDMPEENTGLWVDRIDQKRLGLSREQSFIIQKRLIELRGVFARNGRDLFVTTIDTLIGALSKDDIPTFVDTIIHDTAIQQLLATDSVLWKKLSQLHKKQSIAQFLEHGTGNCKVFAIVSKMILSTGNIRWKLGINKIEFRESHDGHVYLVIHRQDTIQEYDPTRHLYR